MNEEAKLKVTRARIAMIRKQPFFGMLALRLIMVERTDLNPPTAAVDGHRLFYHPDWVMNNDQALVESMIAHEVGHCVFDHIGRRQGRQPRRWNFANDYVVNDVIQDCGFTLGAGWLYSPAFHGMSSDEIYKLLPEDPPGDQFDSHFDKVGGDLDADINTADWQIAAVQAATAQQAAGKMPGSLKRFIDEILNPKADWRTVLWRFATEVTRDDYSWARMNRRFASIGIYLPGLYSEAMGLFIDAIDTSGSISREVLNAFGSEIKGIRDAVTPTRMINIYCDAAVNHVDEFEHGDEITFDMHGGGGTDFRPPFEYIREKGLEPKCMVYLTDGYGPFPEHAPDYPVLWLMTTDVVPPWGEVVRIEV